jgi:hypothetical protein
VKISAKVNEPDPKKQFGYRTPVKDLLGDCSGALKTVGAALIACIQVQL